MTKRKKAQENIVGKGENAGNKHFLLFSQCFLSFPKQFHSFFLTTFILFSTNNLNLDHFTRLLFGS